MERPASVVKELVENAIDAGSSQIDILVEEAGLQTIQVIDNGEGILAEDVENAFKRHATSKIHNRDDLFRIRTLGLWRSFAKYCFCFGDGSGNGQSRRNTRNLFIAQRR